MKALKCIHHWLIEIGIGETSPGKCKHCGEVREFVNVIPPNFPVNTSPEIQRARNKYIRENVMAYFEGDINWR